MSGEDDVPFFQPHADAVCNFFERVLKHTADEWYGKPFLLVPWQEEALSAIFGEVDDARNRVIEMAYLEVPKKAGKSEMAAGLALFVLLTTNTPGCQVYGAAAATRESRNAATGAWAKRRLNEQLPVAISRSSSKARNTLSLKGIGQIEKPPDCS
jgi:phage terminase large subunit-like protein